MQVDSTVGDKIYELCKILFPICRSITGKGTKKTLEIIKTYIPDLNIKNVQSGTKCFDWKIPLEWNINDAYVKDESGKRLIDFNKNNLHVVGYSSPINAVMSYSDLINCPITQMLFLMLLPIIKRIGGFVWNIGKC